MEASAEAGLGLRPNCPVARTRNPAGPAAWKGPKRENEKERGPARGRFPPGSSCGPTAEGSERLATTALFQAFASLKRLPFLLIVVAIATLAALAEPWRRWVAEAASPTRCSAAQVGAALGFACRPANAQCCRWPAAGWLRLRPWRGAGVSCSPLRCSTRLCWPAPGRLPDKPGCCWPPLGAVVGGPCAGHPAGQTLRKPLLAHPECWKTASEPNASASFAADRRSG